VIHSNLEDEGAGNGRSTVVEMIESEGLEEKGVGGAEVPDVVGAKDEHPARAKKERKNDGRREKRG